MSNTLERFIRIAPILLPLLSIARQVSIIFRRACYLLCFARTPARYSDSLGSINELIWSSINFSKTFEKLERVLIGL